MTRAVVRDLKTKLASAIAELEEETARLEEAQARVDDKQQNVDALQRVLGMYRSDEAGDVDDDLMPAKQIRNAIVDILTAANEPLYYKEIHQRLEAMGVKVPGKDPERNVAAHMSNDDRFQSVGGGVWGLVSWPPGKPLGAMQVLTEPAPGTQLPTHNVLTMPDRQQRPHPGWQSNAYVGPDGVDDPEEPSERQPTGTDGIEDVPF